MEGSVRHSQGSWLYFLSTRFAALLTVVVLAFFMMKALPGDPFNDEQALPAEIHSALRAHYGLDAPLTEQFYNHVSALLRWDLGPSFRYKDRTVNQIIAEGFPVSALLGLEAFLLAVAFGVLLGTLSALHKGRWQDRSIFILITLAISLPSFILGTILQYFLAYHYDFFPIARWGTWMQTVLPAISLAAMPCAFIAGLLRTSMLEVIQQNYIRAARARGISYWKIVRRHMLRNALLPVVSYLGPLLANVLVGSFVIEKIYAIPGLGQWYTNSVLNRDYTVIMGITVFYSLILFTTVSLVDFLYRYLDPRMKVGS